MAEKVTTAEAFYNNAALHAEQSDGLLVAYEPGYQEHPHMSLLPTPQHVRVSGTALPPPLSYELATKIDSRFEHVPQAIKDYDTETGIVSAIGERIKSGDNVFIATDENDIMDTPLFEVGLSGFFEEKGIKHRSVTIVSKAIDYLGVNLDALSKTEQEKIDLEGKLKYIGVPINKDGTVLARHFLGLASDDVFFTVPSTRTFEDLRSLHGLEITAYVGMLFALMKPVLSHRGIKRHVPVLAHFAAPGTNNKLLNTQEVIENRNAWSDYGKIDADIFGRDDSRPIQVIGRISTGITGFTSYGLTHAAALRLDPEHPRLAIQERGIHVAGEEDEDKLPQVNLLGDGILRIVRSLDTEYQTVLDRHNTLPVIRK